MARTVKQSGVAVRCRIGLPRAAQRLERALQTQTLGRLLLLPHRRAIRRPTPQRPAQRFQFARCLHAVDVFQPAYRQRNRSSVQKIQTAALDPPCQTRPRPPFGAPHQLSAQGVAFDVSANGEKVLVFLNGEGLEAALVERPGTAAVVVRMPTHGMGQGQPVEEIREFAVLMRPENEVEVVGHEAVGQQAHRHLVLGLAQDTLEGGVVAVFVENGGTSHGAVEDVVDIAASSSTWPSWHAHTLQQPGTRGKIYESRPLFLHVALSQLPPLLM